MKNLIIIGHPNVESFCYNGIYNTIKEELKINKEEVEVIDLYRDSFKRPRVNLIKKYQIYFQNQLSNKDKNLEAFKANSQVGLVVAVLLFIEKQSEFFS